jgi:hypothetical protein
MRYKLIVSKGFKMSKENAQICIVANDEYSTPIRVEIGDQVLSIIVEADYNDDPKVYVNLSK